MSRTTGSWLSGPSAAFDQRDQPQSDYPGQRLGLPESGPGSIVGTGPRLLALFLDWIPFTILTGLTVGFTSQWASFMPVSCWFVVDVVCVALFNVTPGQFVTGICTARVDRNEPTRVGFIRAVARQLLICVMVPPLLQDIDRRGMHDQATGTALVRSR